MLRIPVIEIFSSIQGEGPYVGYRQLFLRLPGCNLACPYCDTPVAASSKLKIERISGSRDFEEIPNPVSLSDLLKLLQSFNLNLHHSLSVTGGEPLLWAEQLDQLLPRVRKLGLKIYLETNGTLPGKLALILPWVDIISMDIKLPYAENNFWQAHQEFLRQARGTKLFIKIVVDRETDLASLEQARSMLKGENKAIPVILQPVTPVRGLRPPEPKQMLQWQEFMLKELFSVRVIPQTHVYLGQL
ncbi:7-carboxy-7-deazaguanine synthase QueE [Paradesulfitobacterium ferrireducens]|uniref:7-carboxy-7-deazaguanine synthase QueE n=1 Tax=Paradesulfitobacterium ferrireducens TaxID=2816476 RepID=UPI001A8EFD18|nr:7-carboxy-7-deazaguanine synthase QueE [Paradesulfitobacterium ferrireducens]